MFALLRAAACGGILSALIGASAAAGPGPDAVAARIRTLVAGSVPQYSASDAGADAAIGRFYGAGDFGAAWFDGMRAKPAVSAALAELAAAPARGLDASDYAGAELAAALQAASPPGVAGDDTAAQTVARADVALTRALLRYLTDLHSGRVAPAAAGFRLQPRADVFDAASLLRQALATGRLAEAADSAEPSFVLYGRLKAALARYRRLADLEWPRLPALPPGTAKVAPGGSYAGARALAERLRLLDDLPAAAALPEGDRYDGAVVVGVRSFQRRHGLDDDGVLGLQTLAALDTPAAERVWQIELALERLRWLPALRPGPLIAVNIPSYTLWAFATPGVPGAQALAMRVIVGRAGRAMQTPVFSGELRYVEFSPYWNVPQGILRNEILPKLARDPGYLPREEMEVVGVRATVAPTTVVDAATLAGLASGELRVRQRPGARNALGGIKFVLPNTMDIYLHGTPAQQLFERTRRDFSHGCIRVADPLALARFALSGRPEWTVERMREAIAAGSPTDVALRAPMPVLIFYMTAIVDNDGRAIFLPDVYGHDARLAEALRKRQRPPRRGG